MGIYSKHFLLCDNSVHRHRDEFISSDKTRNIFGLILRVEKGFLGGRFANYKKFGRHN
jgi:hypothetical protein